MLNILVVDSNPKDMNIPVVRHAGHGIGASYARVLQTIDPSLEATVIAPYDGDVATELDHYHGVVFTGSGVAWDVADERASCLAQLMERVFAVGLPAFGSCNGMQLAAAVLGGTVSASPRGREDGVAINIVLTETGRQHPMMTERENNYSALCVHRDEVSSLPVNADILARNSHSQIQAFAVHSAGVDFWGTQYHPEFSPEFLANYLREKNRVSESAASDLARVEHDGDAAERWGTSTRDMQFDTRTIELQNWLQHVNSRHGFAA